MQKSNSAKTPFGNMKLYNKQLSSLEELRREKIRLRTELRYAKKQDLNPLSGLGESAMSGLAKGGPLGFIVELLGTQSNLKIATSVFGTILKVLGKRNSDRYVRASAVVGPRKKSFFSKIATEIAIGYLIGKSVQVAWHGIALIVKKSKHRKVSTKHLVM